VALIAIPVLVIFGGGLWWFWPRETVETLIRDLGSPDAKVRLTAVQKLGKTMVIEPAVVTVVKSTGSVGPQVGAGQAGAVPPPPPRPPAVDRGKRDVVEPPVAAVVRTSTPGPADTPRNFVNPKVEPGKVRWHPSFAAAREASNKSKKPVLLFNLTGKLDDQFC
jgi:hypothetical protein